MDTVKILNQAIIVIEDFTNQSIKNLLKETCKTTETFEEFCSEMKAYEQTRFLTKGFKSSYFYLKKDYLVKSFAKDMFNKFENSS